MTTELPLLCVTKDTKKKNAIYNAYDYTKSGTGVGDYRIGVNTVKTKSERNISSEENVIRKENFSKESNSNGHQHQHGNATIVEQSWINIHVQYRSASLTINPAFRADACTDCEYI